MNQKDEEAFEDFIELNIDFYSNAPTRVKSAKEAWQAACEYKQKEINKQEKDIIQLAEENQHYFNSLVKLEKENEELKDFLGCIREHDFNIEHGWKNAINKLFKKLEGEE